MVEGLDTLVLGGGKVAPCVYMVVDRYGALRESPPKAYADISVAEDVARQLGGACGVLTVAVDESEPDIWDDEEE